jgi:hypothetical protein
MLDVRPLRLLTAFLAMRSLLYLVAFSLLVPHVSYGQGRIEITSRYPECGDPLSVSYTYAHYVEFMGAIVVSVHDERTIRVHLKSGRSVLVKVAGLKSLPRSSSARRDAKAFLQSLLVGTTVDVLEYGYDYDDFKRLSKIEALVLRNSSDVAMQLLDAGLGHVEASPHLGHLEQCEYYHASDEAKVAKSGLWGL